jgi:hypothetical protein
VARSPGAAGCCRSEDFVEIARQAGRHLVPAAAKPDIAVRADQIGGRCRSVARRDLFVALSRFAAGGASGNAVDRDHPLEGLGHGRRGLGAVADKQQRVARLGEEVIKSR